MKIDLFDAIVGLFILLFLIFAAVETGTWVARKVRSHLLMQRQRRDGIEPEVLPEFNAGFSLDKPASAARRHVAREDEVGLRTQIGWDQRRPPPNP